MLFQGRILKIADQYLGSDSIPLSTQMKMMTSANQSQRSLDSALEKKLDVLMNDVGELKTAISDVDAK